jgi:putative SOS response-associated peptidase YedK
MSATPVDLLTSHFAAQPGDTDGLQQRFNVAPTCVVPVVVAREGSRTLEAMRWGLVPSWAPDQRVGAKMVNARLETLAERPAFRVPLARRRCIVPADGYYEWAPGDPRRPHLIRAEDGGPLAFAGLWEAWYGGPAGALLSCTIVTTASAGPVAWLHHRMPVVLPPSAWSDWLDTDATDAPAAHALLRAVRPAALTAVQVGTRVNDVRNDGADLAEPVDPAAAQTQLPLPF